MRSSMEAVLAIFKRAVYDARLGPHGCAYIVGKLGKLFAPALSTQGARFGISGNAAIIMPELAKA